MLDFERSVPRGTTLETGGGIRMVKERLAAALSEVEPLLRLRPYVVPLPCSARSAFRLHRPFYATGQLFAGCFPKRFQRSVASSQFVRRQSPEGFGRSTAPS